MSDSRKKKKPSKPDAQKTIYVAFATHLDIGYTEPPDRLELLHKQHIDDALELCWRHPDYSYVIECTWLLRQWLKRTDDPARVEELVQRIREGRIEVCGLYASMHSSVMAPEELNQLAYETRRLREELGIEIVTAMQNDVPGYCRQYPQIIAKSGMKYLFAGINVALGGGLDVKPRTKPIYWEGIDGSKVLLQTNLFYALYYQDGLGWFTKRKGGTVKEALARLDSDFAENPCDAAFYIATPGDNRGPKDNFDTMERIREWNTFDTPYRFVAGTPRQYFEHMVAQFDDTFETCKGDWPASYEWDLVKVRAPMSTISYRRAQTLLPTAEKMVALESIDGKKPFPRFDFDQAYTELLNYGEHSAPEGHATPRLTRREMLWSNHVHFFNAYRAWNMAQGLLMQGKRLLADYAQADSDVIAVFNPLSQTRTDLVRVPTIGVRGLGKPVNRRIRRIVDIRSGRDVPFENAWMSDSGEEPFGDDRMPCVRFIAADVPGFGVQTYRVECEEEQDLDLLVPEESNPRDSSCIENVRYRVTVDVETGAISSIHDKELDCDLLAPQNEKDPAFNTITTPTEPNVTGVSVKSIETDHCRRIEIRRNGSWFPETDICLHDGIDRVEIRNVFDRSLWKTEHPDTPVMEALLQMPFGIGKDSANLVVSGPVGFRRIPGDLLPGSAFDTWPSAGFLSIDDGKVNIMLSSPTDYLFMPAEKSDGFFGLQTRVIWQYFEVSSADCGKQILPYTDPKEEDRFAHTYAITSAPGSFNAERAHRFGWGYRCRMIGAVQKFSEENPPVVPRESGSLIALDDPNVEILALRQSLFAGQTQYVLRLQETVGGEKRDISITFHPSMKLQAAWRASICEEPENPIGVRDDRLEIEIGTFETATLLLEFQP